MEIVHAGQMEWGESLVPHRQGTMAHKRIFDGEENTPDNYSLVLAREGADYFSPPHRHNFDQVRYCLEGRVPVGPSLRIDAGEVGYFPEGVAYGPQEGGRNRVVLVLQFGGASDHGYMSAEQAESGRRKLLARGRFEKGVFHPDTATGKRSQDAYAAIWEQVFGRPVAYPAARYKTPIVIRPQAFAWRDADASRGVQRKDLATFIDRGLSLAMVAIAPGASFDTDASADRRLLFVRDGDGSSDGQPWHTYSALRLEPGERSVLTATTQAELLLIAMALLERS